ncbi:hypothetical protein ADUPG1_006945 [Aduncisulcus paluster]|uniref:Uncharacterized protein n=1 Tax=Aduncisulcus paluster TaxID=2918883 RepID=A0ABQ5KK59_9EUKA|nr:hypothetical protein ADUPG1_006945 [Aduncisulcus paluster]
MSKEMEAKRVAPRDITLEEDEEEKPNVGFCSSWKVLLIWVPVTLALCAACWLPFTITAIPSDSDLSDNITFSFWNVSGLDIPTIENGCKSITESQFVVLYGFPYRNDLSDEKDKLETIAKALRKVNDDDLFVPTFQLSEESGLGGTGVAIFSRFKVAETDRMTFSEIENTGGIVATIKTTSSDSQKFIVLAPFFNESASELTEQHTLFNEQISALALDGAEVIAIVNDFNSLTDTQTEGEITFSEVEAASTDDTVYVAGWNSSADVGVKYIEDIAIPSVSEPVHKFMRYYLSLDS